MILVPFVIILLSVAFFYLFVCVDEKGAGCLAKAKIFFWRSFPTFLKAVGTRICGARFVRAIERLSRYVCYEPNPLVQILYFVCAGGGFYVYVT